MRLGVLSGGPDPSCELVRGGGHVRSSSSRRSSSLGSEACSHHSAQFATLNPNQHYGHVYAYLAAFGWSIITVLQDFERRPNMAAAAQRYYTLAEGKPLPRNDTSDQLRTGS